MGYGERLTELWESLYADQKSAVRASCGLSGWFFVEKSVRQDCIGSPSFFNLFTENIRRKVLEPLEPGEFEGQFDSFSILVLRSRILDTQMT